MGGINCLNKYSFMKNWRKKFDKLLEDVEIEHQKKLEIWLRFYRRDIANCFIPKCSRCGEPATRQTRKGKNSQERLGRPSNWGYYCKECYKKGLEREEEAMYGDE